MLTEIALTYSGKHPGKNRGAGQTPPTAFSPNFFVGQEAGRAEEFLACAVVDTQHDYLRTGGPNSYPIRKMERYFMSRTSAVALLVDTRRALSANLHEMPTASERHQAMLQDVERLLLNVRIGRTREFELEYPDRMWVVVSDN